MTLKLCQGPDCHTYTTKDRLKGPAGSKTYQTRRRSSFYYGKGNFCSLNCQNDCWELHGYNAVDHFGRTTPEALARQFPAGEWLKNRAEACHVADQKPTPILQGRDLIPLGIKPGPKMGKLLEKSFQAQLDEHFSTKKDAILWLHKQLDQNKQ